MSVDVMLLPAAVPHEGDRMVRYADRPDEGLQYQYTLHNGGVLVVWRIVDSEPVVEVAYGPGAWSNAKGSLHRTP